MIQQVKYIQVKSHEAILEKRKELASSGAYADLGPADSCSMFYAKEAGFLSRKEERIIFYFFQGLNVYPQNLSIKIKEVTNKADYKSNKQRLVKGVFVVYDFFEQVDVAVEVNMPGALKIFKVTPMKQLLSEQQLGRVYVSSMIRSLYGLNLVWGKYFKPFDGDNPVGQFKAFMHVFVKNSHLKRVYISDAFEAQAIIHGNHMFQIVLQYIKWKQIAHHALDFFTEYIQKNTEAFWQNPYVVILYSELLFLETKYYKSLKAVTILGEKKNFDAFVSFYQSKYLYALGMTKEALKLLHSIKQYNQSKVWLLMADIYSEDGNYTEVLFCLNLLCKTMKPATKYRPDYKEFEQLGKVRWCQRNDELTVFPGFLILKDSLNCIEKLPPDDFYTEVSQLPVWKLNPMQYQVYILITKMQGIFDKSKFQKLISETFIGSWKQYPTVDFKKGLTKQEKTSLVPLQTQLETQQVQRLQLPRFLKESLEMDKYIQCSNIQVQRSLSVINQIESFVESTILKDRAVQVKPNTKIKQLISERLVKIITLSWKDNKIQSCRLRCDYKGLLSILNSLRRTVFSNFVYNEMFEIFFLNQNYKSVLILLSQLLTDLEKLGVKQIQILPYWVEPFVTGIIRDKGLEFLNQTLNQLKLYEEGLIDLIKHSTKWQLKGTQY